MKVVINTCFGGFGLSDKVLLMLKEKGWEIDQFEEAFFDGRYYLTDERADNHSFRSHPDLVEAVEALGESANGGCSELKVVDIPDGTEFEISEYDGLEEIHEVHRKWS